MSGLLSTIIRLFKNALAFPSPATGWSRGLLGEFVSVTVFVLLGLCGLSGCLFAQPSASYTQYSTIATLQLHASVECQANLLTLGEVVHIRASDSWREKLAEIPIGPSPIPGKIQSLTRLDIEEVLTRRGFNPAQFKWAGSQNCRVSRVMKSPPQSTVSEAAQQASTFVSNAASPSSSATQPSIDKSKFIPANTTLASITLAERVATQAISNYLQTKANANTHWEVVPQITPEIAQHFAQRRQILGITGGQAPWDGPQQFEFLIKGPSGEFTLPVTATIRLPELVLAAAKQLPKGHILRETDLVHVPMPRGMKESIKNCYTDIDELLGKELKRSLSLNQPIRRADAGTETLIQAGDAIKIVVLAGDLVVESNGRALESGGQDELIQVEEADYKARLVARITGPRVVEVNSQGTTIKRQAARGSIPNRIRK